MFLNLCKWADYWLVTFNQNKTDHGVLDIKLSNQISNQRPGYHILLFDRQFENLKWKFELLK